MNAEKETNLEKKIIHSVYTFERKRTFAWVVTYTLVLTFLLLAIVYILTAIITTYNEQGTLDILDLFNQDTDLIRKYFFEAIDTLYQEAPENLPLYLFILVTVVGGLTYVISRNFRKIKNKIHSLRIYFKT